MIKNFNLLFGIFQKLGISSAVCRRRPHHRLWKMPHHVKGYYNTKSPHHISSVVRSHAAMHPSSQRCALNWFQKPLTDSFLTHPMRFLLVFLLSWNVNKNLFLSWLAANDSCIHISKIECFYGWFSLDFPSLLLWKKSQLSSAKKINTWFYFLS